MTTTTKEATKPIARALTSAEQDELYETLLALEEKYESLVWYARKEPSSNEKFWNRVPEQVKIGAANAAAKVEEFHPDEVEKLKCPNCADWQHGFHSGMLAALRISTMAMKPVLIDDDEEMGPYWFGGVEDAMENFPDLGT